MTVWRPPINSAGLRGPIPETEYPSRETALALVAALKGDDWGSITELGRVAGVDDFSSTAERCFMVYGYPELEPVAVARRVSEVFMRPTPKTPIAPPEGVTGGSNGTDRPSTPGTPSASPESPERVTYGFTRRS